jgi:hypothetical protein
MPLSKRHGGMPTGKPRSRVPAAAAFPNRGRGGSILNSALTVKVSRRGWATPRSAGSGGRGADCRWSSRALSAIIHASTSWTAPTLYEQRPAPSPAPGEQDRVGFGSRLPASAVRQSEENPAAPAMAGLPGIGKQPLRPVPASAGHCAGCRGGRSPIGKRPPARRTVRRAGLPPQRDALPRLAPRVGRRDAAAGSKRHGRWGGPVRSA